MLNIRLWIFTVLIFLSFAKNSLLAEPNNVVFFGDSSSDSGYFAINPSIIGDSGSIYTSGVETVRPGLVWTESFGARFGISVKSVDGDISNATTNDGNSYAASGSRVSQTYTSGATGTWTTENQVDRYLSDTNGHADSNTIYSFTSSNDLKFFNDTTTTGGVNYIDASSGDSNSDTYSYGSYGDINDLVSDYTTQLLKVKNAGGRYFLVDKDFVSAPTSAIANFFNDAGILNIQYNSSANDQVDEYNASLLSSLQASGINVIWFDKENVMNDVFNNYAAFGLTTTGMQNPACTFDDTGYSIGAAYNYNTVTCAADAQTAYWFADYGQHLAPAMQTILSDAKYNLFVAPIQISYLPETTFKVRWNANGIINSQISDSFTKNKPNNSWMTLDTGLFNQKQENAGYQDLTSRSYSLLVGHDYKFNDSYLVGASLAFNYATNEYGNNRGDFVQNEKTISLYGSHNKIIQTSTEQHTFNANVILSEGLIGNEISRLVPIGITTQHLNSDTDSYNTSLEINAKYNVKSIMSQNFDFNHGPSARLLMQRVRVEAFNETNAGDMSSIALGFNKQKAESTTADVGYIFGISNFSWNYYIDSHLVYELASLSRKIETRIISESTEPSYYLMTPEKDRASANITFGVDYAYSENIKTKIALHSFITQNIDYTYMASLNLGYSF